MSMNNRSGAAPLAALLFLASSTALVASPTVREHGAHEHGHGVLEMAMDGHDLHLEMRIPAINVVGFEHAPSTDAQREAVRRALATFKRGQDLFAPSAAARCALESAEATLGEERDHEHQHGHAKEEHKDHGHGHGHGDAKQAHADGEVHSELRAVWRFHCDAPDKLERIDVKVFEHLHDVEKIEAQVVTTTLQKAVALQPGNAALDLTGR